MARWYGKTAERGYGASHVAMRARLLAAWRPGQPCARCGLPMLQRWMLDSAGKRVSAMDLGHTDDRRGWTGLEHRACNRRDGQRKTTVINRAAGRPLTPAQLAAIRWKQWQSAARQGARR